MSLTFRGRGIWSKSSSLAGGSGDTGFSERLGEFSVMFVPPGERLSNDSSQVVGPCESISWSRRSWRGS